jgi:hypothetical protein
MTLSSWLSRHHEPPEDDWPECWECDGAGCDDCEDGYIDPDKLREIHEEARADWMID